MVVGTADALSDSAFVPVSELTSLDVDCDCSLIGLADFSSFEVVSVFSFSVESETIVLVNSSTFDSFVPQLL